MLVAVYWFGSAALIYGLSSGQIPLSRWLSSEGVSAEDVAPPAMSPSRQPLVATRPASVAPEISQSTTTRARMDATTTATSAFEAPPSSSMATVRDDPARTIAALTEEPIDPPISARSREATPPTDSLRVDGIESLWRASLRELPLPSEESEEDTEPARPTANANDDAPAIAPPIGASCESAIAAYHEEIDVRNGHRSPDLPRSAFASVLEDGRYMAPCQVPAEMAVEICAAVQNGRAVGVTVVTHPANQRVRVCVANAVRRLSFPNSEKLDVTHTRFAAAR